MSDKEDIDLEDFDLDDELDFGSDFDMPESPIKDDRSAVSTIATGVAKGAANAVIGPGKRRSLIVNSLPKDYQVAIGSYDTIASGSKEIIQHAKQQLGESKRELQRAAREAGPILKKYLPASLTKRIDKFAENTSYTGGYEEVDPREAAIKAALSDTFDSQRTHRDAVAAQQSEVQERVEGEIEKATNIKRQDNLYEMVAAIRGEIAKQTSLSIGPGESYRRKTLELSYRQLYAMTDIHETLKTAFEKLLPNSDGILKNTALPDYAKEEFGEITSALMKRELIRAASPGEFARNYIAQLSGNIKTAISETLTGFTENVSTAVSIASGAMDDDRELSPEEQRKQMMKTGASIAGGMLADKYVTPQIKKGQAWVREKLEGNESIMSAGRRARYILGTMPEYLNDLSKDPSRHGSGASEFLGNILQSVLPSYGGDNATLNNLTTDALSSPKPFTSKDNIALTDVIPNLLSTINASVLSLRGVNSDVMQYDYEAGKFISEKAIQDTIREDIGDNQTREWAMRAIDEMVKTINHDGKLSSDAQTDLGRVIDERIRKVGQFNVADLADNFEAYTGTSGKATNELMDFFMSMKEDKVRMEETNITVSEDIQRVRDSIRPVQDRVDELAKRYGDRAMIDADVFKSDGGRISLNQDILKSDTRFGARNAGPNAEIEAVVNGIVGAIREHTPPPKKGKPKSADSITDMANSITDDVYGGVRRAMFGEEEPNLQSLLRSVAKNDDGKDCERLAGLVETIRDQLVANNLTPQVDSILQILSELAISGIPISGEGTSEEVKQRAGYFGKFGQHVSAGAARAKTGLNNAVQYVAGKGRALRDYINKKIPSKLDALKNLYDGGMAGLRSFKDGVLGITSIYDADGNIVLHGRLLKLGKYFDADGKVIKSIKDIKGAIYDENGEVVISMEDIQDKLSGLKYYAKDGWKRFSEMVGKNVGTFTNKVLGVPKIITDKLTMAADWTKRNVLASPDIYVKGETSPRLRQMLIRKGYYVDQKTGKVIITVADIKGPVMTRDNIIVISAEELADPKFELVDINGKPFKTMYEKAFDLAIAGKNRIVSAGKKLWELAGKAATTASQKLGDAKEYIKGKVSGGIGGGIGKKGAADIVGKLTEIYNLLDDRMRGGKKGKKGGKDEPEKPKPAIDDVDGDGDRDGSFTDQFKNRAKRAADRAKAKVEEMRAKRASKKEEDGDKSGFFGSLLSSLGSALTGIGTKIGSIMATVFGGKTLSMLTDGLGSLLSKLNPFSAAGAARTAGVAAGAATAGTVSGGATAAAGAAGGAAAATSKRAAVRTMIARGASAVGRSVLWQGARMAGAAVLGVLSAPVVLAVGAVAGLGYLAYSALTRNDPLTKLRMAQYGTEDYSDSKSDEVAKLTYLEDAMLKFTSWDSNGISRIKGIKNEHIAAMANGLELDTSDTGKIEMFEKWLFGRFIPVFLLWTTRAKQFAPGIAMKDVGDDKKVDPRAMMKILKGVVLEEGHPVFTVMHSPFSERGWGDTIGGWFGGDDMMSAESVAEVAKETEEAILDMDKWDKDKKKASEQMLTKSSSVVPVKTETALDKTKKQTVKPVGTVPFSPLIKDGDTGTSSPSSKSKNVDVKSPAFLVGLKDVIPKSRDSGSVNAIEAIRLKTYGLTELTAANVELLWELESAVIKDIKVTAHSADVKISLSDITAKFMPLFGLQVNEPAHVTRWQAWFEKRFVTVLLRYMMRLKSYAPGADPLRAIVSTNTPYMKKLAADLISTSVHFEGKKVSIWTLTSSPFPTATVGTDPSITADNMRFLEDLVSRSKVTEQAKVEITAGTAAPVTTRPKPKMPPRRPGATAMNDLIDAQYAEMNGGDGDSGSSGPYSPSSDFDIPSGPFKEGQVDANGSYAKIRLRTNDKASVAEMLKEVSKLTGVDQNLLLTFAMMESSMNPKAGAGTSSAKGLFQFLDGTWNDVMSKHANKYGIPAGASPYDPVANAILGAEYIKGGAKEVGKLAPSGKPEAADMYLAHFMGYGGVKQFLRGLNSTPDRLAALDFRSAAKANPNVFLGPQGALSYADMYEKIRKKARTNFSYVAKYSDNPIFESAKPVISGANTAPPMRPNLNTDTSLSSPVSEERMSEITKTKAVNDVGNAMANAKVNESVSMSAPAASAASSNVEARKAAGNELSKKVTTVEESTPDNKKEILTDYVREVENQVKANARKVAPAPMIDAMSVIGNKQIEQGNATLEVLRAQLDAQTSMVHHLAQINEKMALLAPSTREADQVLRNHTRAPAPVMQHGVGPISVSRVTTR